LGIANQITMIRGWGISIMAGFIFSDPLTPGDSKAIAWLVGIVYLMVAGADVLDGLWARRTRTETLLGQTMDTEMDALGLLIAAALAVKLGHLPFWYLSVGLSYYVYQLGLWHHKRRRKAIYPLKARPFRRVIAGIQMGFVGAGLLPIFDAGALQVAAICFSLPFLAGFLWDWKTVSGGLHQVSEERWIIFFNKLAGVLPLFLRSVLLVGGMLVSKGFLAAEMLAWLHGLWWILWGLMVSGCLGRLAACGMSFLLALRPAMVGDPLVLMVLMGGTTGLVMLGTGKGSIWQPENRFFDGELGAAGSVSAPDRINREHQLLRH
jgi:CDP-diacylglycerol--glycerol-3-phosphate 3-phosphatidyltransferase